MPVDNSGRYKACPAQGHQSDTKRKVRPGERHNCAKSQQEAADNTRNESQRTCQFATHSSPIQPNGSRKADRTSRHQTDTQRNIHAGYDQNCTYRQHKAGNNRGDLCESVLNHLLDFTNAGLRSVTKEIVGRQIEIKSACATSTRPGTASRVGSKDIQLVKACGVLFQLLGSTSSVIEIISQRPSADSSAIHS